MNGSRIMETNENKMNRPDGTQNWNTIFSNGLHPLLKINRPYRTCYWNFKN
jgi:hypothetical protein